MAESSKSGRPNVFHFLIRLFFSVLRSSCLIKRVDEMWKQKKAKVPIKCYLTGTFAFLQDLGYFLAGCIIFQIPAAQAPPTNGPTMKIQRLARAVPPWNTAGAIERAGFTDVPV